MDKVIANVSIPRVSGPVDIGVEDDRIVAVKPDLSAEDAEVFDGEGGLVLPGFVNPHMHFDKCMLGDVMRENVSQTLQEAIEITWDHKTEYVVEEIVERASPVVESAILNGTTSVRAFADVDSKAGLTAVRALRELEKRWSERIDMEVVAFPQEGILRDPGCKELMAKAMEEGADIVGGMPWHERTDYEMREHVDFCLALAAKYNADVHMLVDDTDNPYSRSLEYLAVRTADLQYEGRVSASHCGALAAYDDNHAEKVIGLVKEAGISIISNAHISLVLDGRSDRGLIRRGTTRVKELLSAGVNVAAGQDDVNDPYYPFGRCDQLEVAQYTAHVAQLTFPSELKSVLDMVSYNGARALGLDNYGVSVGDVASFVVMPAASFQEALRLMPVRKYVFYRGKLVARGSVASELI